jgi:hypothetical protein
MECFLVKVDVFMEWKCQPTGIVEFLRLNSRKVWSRYGSQWNKPLEINQKKILRWIHARSILCESMLIHQQ